MAKVFEGAFGPPWRRRQCDAGYPPQLLSFARIAAHALPWLDKRGAECCDYDQPFPPGRRR